MPVPPSTLDDLVRVAATAGQPMTLRAVTDWIQRGLLDHPQRRRGTGKGSSKAIVTEHQRKLFALLLRHRPTNPRLATLAAIPVTIWIYWGDEYVPLGQTRRALTTWLDRATSTPQATSKHMAREIAEQLAHPDAATTARQRLVRLLKEAIYRARIDDPDQLRQTLTEVFDPHSEGRTIGPSGAAINADQWLGSILLRDQATVAFLNGRIQTEQFNHARRELVQTLTEYRGLQASWTVGGPDAEAWGDGPSPSELVNNACPHLLLALGAGIRDAARTT